MVERTVTSIHGAKKQGELESYLLRGTITGSKCADGNQFSGFYSKANQLIENFSESFKKFQIIEDAGAASGILFVNGHAIIRSVDFEDSVYAGILPFSVNLDVYREGSFERHGVLNPSQQVSFEQRDNGDISISKTTKANGFNTAYPALQNAVSFVQGITGLDTSFLPTFIPNDHIENSILVSFDEKINRMEGSYEVKEGWIYNIYGNHGNYSLNEKTVSLKSGEGVISVSVNGKLKGGINSSFSDLRSDFSNIDTFGIADDIYSQNASGSLYVQPISKQITEDSLEKTIDFTVVYADTIKEDPYLIDFISVSYDHLNNKICSQGNVTIKSSDFCPSSRWTKVKNYANNFSIVGWMKTRLASLGYGLNLPNQPLNSSYSYNEQAGTISISATLCDKKIIIPNGFDDFNYTVEIVPSLLSFVVMETLCSLSAQQLIGNKRSTVTIQGNGQISNCVTFEQAKTSLLSYMNDLKFVYITGSDTYLVRHMIQQGEGESRNKVSFSFTWNENGVLLTG